MEDPYIGEMLLVPYDFAPSGWALCNGQLLQITQNAALFSLIGTTYGGDGRTTFALPDLRGRVGVHAGTLVGGGTYAQGARAGAEAVTLSMLEIDPLLSAADETTNRGGTGSVLARGGAYDGASASMVLGSAGLGMPHPNMPPYLTLNWIIALVGIFPSRT